MFFCNHVLKKITDFSGKFIALRITAAVCCAVWGGAVGTDRYGCVRMGTDGYGERGRRMRCITLRELCALYYPAVTLRPSQIILRQSKPTGYNMTPPSSSYKFYRSYKSYKSYASVTPCADCIPPLQSSCPALPCGNSCARAKTHSGMQTHGV